MTRIIFVFALYFIHSIANAQVKEEKLQINYEVLPDAVKYALGDEIERMNLDAIRFNFYRLKGTQNYPVEFLRKGVDIKALEGLETIIFDFDGSILEKRYKYYSEEILMSAPLDLIMTMQEKTKNVDLKYLMKYDVTDRPVTYRAIAEDSTYLFNYRMEFLESIKTIEVTEDIAEY